MRWVERSEPGNHPPRPYGARHRGGAKRVLAALPAEAEETLRTTRELNIAFVAYSPLGRGLLTGVVEDPNTMADSDARRRHPRFAAGEYRRQYGAGAPHPTIARQKNCTPGQLALAWLLAQGDDIVPIPGTKRKDRLVENIGALSVTLGADDLAEIAKRRSDRRGRRRALSRSADEDRLCVRAAVAKERLSRVKVLDLLGFGHQIDRHFLEIARSGHVRAGARKQDTCVRRVSKIVGDFRNHDRPLA